MKQRFFFLFYQYGQENTKMFDLVTNSVDTIIIIISSSSINIIITIILIIIIALNPRPTKGGGLLLPQTVSLQPHKNAKESDPGHLRHLFYILCGHFDEKTKTKTGVPPLDGGRVSRQSSKVGRCLPPKNILSRHFEKYVHGMVLKLSGHVRNTIFLFICKKLGEIPIFGTFLAKKIDFLSILV